MTDLQKALAWPFFDDGHRRFADAIGRWADATLPALPHDDVDAACRARVKALGARYDKLTFKYTGPWPPYNFVNIRLKLERA